MISSSTWVAEEGREREKKKGLCHYTNILAVTCMRCLSEDFPSGETCQHEYITKFLCQLLGTRATYTRCRQKNMISSTAPAPGTHYFVTGRNVFIILLVLTRPRSRPRLSPASSSGISVDLDVFRCFLFFLLLFLLLFLLPFLSPFLLSLFIYFWHLTCFCSFSFVQLNFIFLRVHFPHFFPSSSSSSSSSCSNTSPETDTFAHALPESP